LLHVRALHLADAAPYALEDRWINSTIVPDALDQTFQSVSANEWLLAHAPYTHGDIAFSAQAASNSEAQSLGCAAHCALFAIDRLTWDKGASVTKVRLLFSPGHQVRTVL
jgi:GntR family histidine utilization transcriptional repressor